MKKYLIIAILFSFTFVGCEKNLDIDPISVINKESYLKLEGDVEPTINGMYFRMRPLANLDLFVYGESRSEVMEGTGLAGTLGYERLYTNALTRDNHYGEWTAFYQAIDVANLIIKYVPDIPFNNAANKSNALAQAYTMRAYLYFTLAKTWGDVPIRTQPTESYDPVAIQVAKSPVADVFKLIKEDLDKAISLYPNNNLATGRFKWSKPAANAVKADVYLWTGKRFGGGNADFTTALNAITDLQTTTGLSLLPAYADIFKYANKGNNEILMAVRFTSSEPASPLQTYAHNMYASNTTFPADIPASQVAIVANPLAGNGNVWRVTKLVRDQFTSDDTRKAATFVELIGTGTTGYYTNYGLKFNGTVENGARIFASDFILYRYADILLMKAEAKNALLQDPTAEMVLVRQRAYGANYPAHAFVNGSPAQNDDAILKERLLELTLESKRWYDLVRFGKAFTLVPSLVGRSAQTHLQYWPVGIPTRTKEPLVTETTGY
jgi:hypothetical protein